MQKWLVTEQGLPPSANATSFFPSISDPVYLIICGSHVPLLQRLSVIVAVGVNSDGRREVLGVDIGPSEAETFWTAFLRAQARPPRPAWR